MTISSGNKILASDVTAHINNKSNPHGITPASIGAATTAEINELKTSINETSPNLSLFKLICNPISYFTVGTTAITTTGYVSSGWKTLTLNSAVDYIAYKNNIDSEAFFCPRGGESVSPYSQYGSKCRFKEDGVTVEVYVCSGNTQVSLYSCTPNF